MSDVSPFPAPKNTPGQSMSRAAYRLFRASLSAYPWAEEFQDLVDAGYQWRVAVYILWASTPTKLRVPDTQMTLATEVLGLKDDQAIRKWKHSQPEIQAEIIARQAGPLLQRRADVIQATIDNALCADGHQDRKLFFTLTGDIGPDVDVNVAVKVKGYVGVSPDDWDQNEPPAVPAAAGSSGAVPAVPVAGGAVA